MRWKIPVPDDMVFRVDRAPVAIHGVNAGVPIEEVRNPVQRLGSQHVIAVEVCHDLTRGVLESFTHRVGLSAVGPRLEVVEMVLVSFKYFNGAIPRPSIHDHILKVWIPLKNHAAHGPLNKARVIVARGDDRNSGIVHIKITFWKKLHKGNRLYPDSPRVILTMWRCFGHDW